MSVGRVHVAGGIAHYLQTGSLVTITLKNVPQSVLQTSDSHGPFVMFALLKHEHKISVMNFTVQRNTEYTAPVRSKVYHFLPSAWFDADVRRYI
jgi:40S ribosome biogenesis protein Tsr1 and BMS1 C-terminal